MQAPTNQPSLRFVWQREGMATLVDFVVESNVSICLYRTQVITKFPKINT